MREDGGKHSQILANCLLKAKDPSLRHAIGDSLVRPAWRKIWDSLNVDGVLGQPRVVVVVEKLCCVCIIIALVCCEKAHETAQSDEFICWDVSGAGGGVIVVVDGGFHNHGQLEFQAAKVLEGLSDVAR